MKIKCIMNEFEVHVVSKKCNDKGSEVLNID